MLESRYCSFTAVSLLVQVSGWGKSILKLTLAAEARTGAELDNTKMWGYTILPKSVCFVRVCFFACVPEMDPILFYCLEKASNIFILGWN